MSRFLFRRQFFRINSKNFPNSSFLNNIKRLVVAGGFVQLVALFASPLLTRLYTPQDFALFTLYMSSLSFLTPAVSGKLDAALVVSVSRRESFLVGKVGFILTAILSTLMLMFSLTGLQNIQTISSLGNFIYLLPLNAFVIGANCLYKGILNKNKLYRVLSRHNVRIGISTLAISIGFGLAGQKNGLIFGALMPLLLFSLWLLIIFRSKFTCLFTTKGLFRITL